MSFVTFDFNFDRLNNYLLNSAVPFKRDFSLKYETYFKRGGVAAFYIAPTSVQQLVELVGYLKSYEISWKLVGLSTNVLFFDDIEYGVIVTAKNITGIEFKDDKFVVDCGYSLQDLVRAALINGRGGIEGLEGVPGTVGGAVFMNAGAYGYLISDHLVSVDVITPEGLLITLPKEKCGFSSRDSFFKRNPAHIICSATFNFPVVERQLSASKIEVFHIARHSYQEFAYPNLGSMFSVKSDFYKEFFKESSFYLGLCWVLKILIKNPVVKFIQRKRPNNKIFNMLAVLYVGSEIGEYQPSSKSMNILINDGQTSTEQILSYLQLVKLRLDKTTPIENEIIKQPINMASSSSIAFIKSIKDKGL